MVSRRKLLKTGGALCAVAALAGCGGPDSSIELHVKVTARAVADGVPREGSSVLLVHVAHTPNSLSRMQMRMSLKGEATILDMGRGRVAYFLLKDYLPDLVTGYRIWEPGKEAWSAETIPGLRAASGEIEIKRDRYPKIAAFRDERDPATVYEVEPGNFAAAFGPGVAFRSLTLELVDAPMTEAIEKKLPWLGTWAGPFAPWPAETRTIAVRDATFGQLLRRRNFINDGNGS